MKNLLMFHLEVQFGSDIKVVANNEMDLENYLKEEHNFSDINFLDIDKDYGTCDFKEQYNVHREVAKCFYLKYI